LVRLPGRHSCSCRRRNFKCTSQAAIAERNRLLQEAGYQVIHFTWQELFGDAARVAGRIRKAFGR